MMHLQLVRQKALPDVKSEVRRDCERSMNLKRRNANLNMKRTREVL